MVQEITITFKAEFPDDVDEIVADRIYEKESMIEEWWDEMVEEYNGEPIYENI